MQAVAIQSVIVYWNAALNWFTYAGGIYDIAMQSDANYGCYDPKNSTDQAM